MRNTKNCKKLYRVYKLGRKTKTNGNTFGEQQNTQQRTTTNTFTRKYSPQNLSYGFGIPNAATS